MVLAFAQGLVDLDYIGDVTPKFCNISLCFLDGGGKSLVQGLGFHEIGRDALSLSVLLIFQLILIGNNLIHSQLLFVKEYRLRRL